MSEKQTKFGLFPGGDPRNFEPDASICTEEQISAWRFDCQLWNEADARGQILSDLPSQTVAGGILMSDCANSFYGAGTFEIEIAASEPEPPAELDAETFNQIMAAPSQKLSFKAVLG